MEQFKLYYLDSITDRYAQFSGRASRSEFWYFILFNFIVSIILSVLDNVLGTNYTYEVVAVTPVIADTGVASTAMTQTIGYLSTLYGLALIIPGISVSVRRLHDIGKSGWWLFISLIPIIGLFVLLFFYVKDSQEGRNEYGENPKEV